MLVIATSWTPRRQVVQVVRCSLQLVAPRYSSHMEWQSSGHAERQYWYPLYSCLQYQLSQPHLTQRVTTFPCASRQHLPVAQQRQCTGTLTLVVTHTSEAQEPFTASDPLPASGSASLGAATGTRQACCPQCALGALCIACRASEDVTTVSRPGGCRRCESRDVGDDDVDLSVHCVEC
jgi:hypothetical protein